jgi:hypothetical protein
LAGYPDGAAASKALGDSQTWATLARAQADNAAQHPLARSLLAAWRRAARAEVKARRAARVWLHTSAPRGGRRACGRRAVGVRLGLDGAAGLLVRSVQSSRAPWLSRKARSLAVDIGAAARRAIDSREQAARVTSGVAARLRAFRARAARSWESASRGLRRGFMQ